jgi:hypothetical protein
MYIVQSHLIYGSKYRKNWTPRKVLAIRYMSFGNPTGPDFYVFNETLVKNSLTLDWIHKTSRNQIYFDNNYVVFDWLQY